MTHFWKLIESLQLIFWKMEILDVLVVNIECETENIIRLCNVYK